MIFISRIKYVPQSHFNFDPQFTVHDIYETNQDNILGASHTHE